MLCSTLALARQMKTHSECIIELAIYYTSEILAVIQKQEQGLQDPPKKKSWMRSEVISIFVIGLLFSQAFVYR